MATATENVREMNSGLLAEHGGSLNISKSWAKLLLDRMGWVKRKGTEAERKVPDKRVKITEDFLKRVEENEKK